jgi:ubiquinone/menaquinone biosynthesis C-methylase UbiE
LKKRILNIGCGNSDYGTDRIDLYKTKTTTKIVDLEKGLPYPNKTFDEIYCKSVLEHIKNLGIFVDECYRVLKNGGKIWIRTDYAGYLPFHILKNHEHNKELDRHYETGPGFGHNKNEDAHYHLFVQSHLEKLFCKFKNKKFTFFYGGRNKTLNFIAKILPNNLGAFHIEMEAYK